MCGIAGLQLRDPSLHPQLGALLTDMLCQVAERGPDSAGFGVYSGPPWMPTESDQELVVTRLGASLTVVKGIGGAADLAAATGLASASGWQAIAHTRMATESAVTIAHGHPFTAPEDFCLVHNGSFSNYASIRRELIADGISFETDNDSEVAARFIAAHLADGDDLEKALRRLVIELARGERIAAEAVVLAAGFWSRALLAEINIDLPIQAQREAILLIEAEAGSSLHGRPVFSDLVGLQYARPERSGQLLVGNSDHTDPEWADPDEYSNRASDDFLERALPKIAHRFPGLGEARLASSYAGCYDVTPDYNPVMSATAVDGLFVAAGFSGHGFKISPAVGELMADLVVHGDSQDPLVPASDFALSRFAEGRLLASAHTYAGAGQMR